MKRENRPIQQRFDLYAESRKKENQKTGQSEKSQKGSISPICGEAPLNRIQPNFAWYVMSTT